jgi:hypothetical protein
MRFDRSYKDDVTLWTVGTGDDGFGKINMSTPISFKGRWEDKQELFTNRAGEQVVSRAAVYLPDTSDVSVTLESWLYRGVSVVVDPRSLKGAYQVRALNEVPDIRHLKKERVALI